MRTVVGFCISGVGIAFSRVLRSRAKSASPCKLTRPRRHRRFESERGPTFTGLLAHVENPLTALSSDQWALAIDEAPERRIVENRTAFTQVDWLVTLCNKGSYEMLQGVVTRCNKGCHIMLQGLLRDVTRVVTKGYKGLENVKPSTCWFLSLCTFRQTLLYERIEKKNTYSHRGKGRERSGGIARSALSHERAAPAAKTRTAPSHSHAVAEVPHAAPSLQKSDAGHIHSIQSRTRGTSHGFIITELTCPFCRPFCR